MKRAVILSLFLCSYENLGFAESRASIKSTKVAYIGDSGHHQNFKKVLSLIKSEQADVVVHAGDLAYDENNPNGPLLWEQKINEVLGESFPYLFLIGNHDAARWNQSQPDGYAAIYKRRLSKNSEVHCVGDEGVKSYCSYRDVFFVLSGVGSQGDRHVDFIGHALRQTQKSPWRVCAWHKNQRDMQAGHKSDEVGWDAYKMCQSHGAMIATGHEHNYARTMNLNNVGDRSHDHGAFGDPKNLELSSGKTFVFVSGLGGASLRPVHCARAQKGWWATVFANNYLLQNGALTFSQCIKDDLRDTVEPGGPTHYNYGALFITYGVDGDARLAKAQFKTIDGIVIDEFTIRSKL